MDFSKLGSTKKKPLPTNPIKLFETLPNLENTPNDLWRGQYKALTDWEEVRKKQDVLISLNTGAGKTIIGLLIAQSLVNESIENVIYVCSTIDLVRQTAAEADRIGIDYTVRVQQQFSNDRFETGKAFCITTYAALFNGYSALRNKYFPGAIVFDDAHVAENLLRDAFTIRIDSRAHTELFNEIAELFRPHFEELGIPGQFENTLDLSNYSTSFVAPNGLYIRRNRLLEILRRHDVKNNNDFKYQFAWLEDHLNACAAVFRSGVFELTPPFMPSQALDIFRQDIRRVYLSATLESMVDFIRAFGRKPSATITPANDAGNGERLFINGRDIKKGFGPEFAKGLVKSRKAVIAIPDYYRASNWRDLAEPPKPDDFSDGLDEFRKADNGAFLLVSRVDGIDLPHETCRLMIVDGIPSGSSLLERYQWEVLRMNNVHRVRIANRLAQLFGRINRGRNDYGAFLIEGSELNKWLANDRNLALFPPLLQQQILLGREIQAGFNMKSQSDAAKVIDRVLKRDKGWLDYYQREVKLVELDQDQLERHNTAEPFLEAAALSEAEYATAMWRGDPQKARRELEKTVDETTKHDTFLGGWHALWLGAAYDLEDDHDSAFIAYGQAVRRLGQSLVLPRPAGGRVTKVQTPSSNPFERALIDILSYTHGDKFEKEFIKLRQTLTLIHAGTPNQAEVGVRALGEILGYTATRPDNDDGTGPDVLWREEASSRMVGFELKTDKDDQAEYFKKDISQGHDHLEWMKQNYSNDQILGLIYVGPEGSVDSKANPSKEMGLCTTESMKTLCGKVLALIQDLRNESPLERIPAIHKASKSNEWEMETVLKGLWDKTLTDAVD